MLKPPTSSASHDSNDHQNDPNERPPRLARSPHPYHRRKSQVQNATASLDSTAQSTPAVTPAVSDTAGQGSSSYFARKSASTPSGSGSDTEEYGLRFVKSLPAPPVKHRKGLLDGSDQVQDSVTPALTPSWPSEVQKHGDGAYFEQQVTNRDAEKKHEEEARLARKKRRRRRNAEILRRSCEVLSLASISLVVFSGPRVLESIYESHRALLGHIAVMLFLFVLYPVRLLLLPQWERPVFRLGKIHIPSRFDPAPLLYPTILPALVAISISPAYPEALMPNIILGLSAIPIPLIPTLGSWNHYGIHWLISLIPLIAAENTAWPSKLFPFLPYKLQATSHPILEPELLTFLYPFHQSLLPIVQYLTTTSLLSSEHSLLSISLINVLLLSKTPQSVILSAILWIGGFGLLILCGRIIQWNVTLERIPNWGFQPPGNSRPPSRRPTTRESLDVKHDKQNSLGNAREKGTNTNELQRATTLVSFDTQDSMHSWEFSAQKDGNSANTNQNSEVGSMNGSTREAKTAETLLKRVHTLPPTSTGLSDEVAATRRNSTHKRAFSVNSQSYLHMTPRRTEIKKWMYAGFAYLAVIVLILGPIRSFIGWKALGNHEPFGWAVGYLFGDMPAVRSLVYDYNLNSWIALPDLGHTTTLDLPLQIRLTIPGPTTIRLLLFGYWATVILLGVLSVLTLATYAEVDTRRKIFHGTMVAMLLPTAYIDPCFLALGLVLVLAVFLLLDIIRAGQLKPLSKPLALFLAPYVDGRDLQGPVVVSHMFLLIGCAIPLWLSLASIEREGQQPWVGWDVQTRDISMLAGVVCVGMGDAAASLIGRRYGRRKWPWAGGKSLEGSAAFAIAVTVGLMFGKVWLEVGGWDTSYDAYDSWFMTLMKATVAGSGASFTEAVLTGCNDNVVVPVVLWLLVRGLGL